MSILKLTPLAFLVLTFTSCGQSLPRETSTLRAETANELRTSDPLPTERHIRLAQFTGKSFYTVMMQEGGIVDLMTEDQHAPFALADAPEILDTLNSHFTSKVVRKTGDQERLTETIRELQDEEDEDGYSTYELKQLGVDRAAVEIIGLSSGAGVQVEIDSDNYFYNIAYEEGERKPGRSYVVGPARLSDDTSYPDYFERMEEHFEASSEESIALFFSSMLEVLTESEVASVDAMNMYGENLFGDFIMIYVAEAYCKLTGGSGGSFHVDLMETTLLSAWSHLTRKVPTPHDAEFEVIDGDLKAFINRSENGSGLGFHWPRRELQDLVCEAVRELDAAVIERVEAITGAYEGSDCYETIAWFLNDPDSQEQLANQADELTAAIVSFVMFTREHADEITQIIE